MKVNWEQMTEQDLKIITKQLGREPRGVLGIAKRCCYGYPQIIINRPIVYEGETLRVFPTTFWLTCPFLSRAISRLEGGGLVGTLQDKVNTDNEFAAKVAENHREHAQFRTSLISDEMLNSLAKNYPNEYKVLTKTGIGGVRSFEGVKCLHAHFSDYMILGSNVIGAMVYDLLGGNLNCSSGNCSLED